MKTENVIKLNRIIGDALIDCANEAKANRLKTMKSRPFEEVVEAMKTYKTTKCNKANGYFATDAIKYFDSRLENECNEIWLEIEDTMDADWLKAIEVFKW